MSSTLSIFEVDRAGQVAQEQALIHLTTSAQVIPSEKADMNSEDDAGDSKLPIVNVTGPCMDEGNISEVNSSHSVSSSNEDWPNEKGQAQQIRIADLKTAAKSNVYNLAKDRTKQETWSSVKTAVNAPKSNLLSSSSFTTEKLRLRTSPPDQSNQVARWGIDWHQPFYMLGVFFLGLAGMICHHVYNSHWNGRIVGNPQWIQRFGSGFSFFSQMCMVGAANIAYKQLVWLTIKKRKYTIETLDGMFAICTDPLRYFNIELLLKATMPAILAGVVWCLPLCAIVSPSTLTSVGGVREKPSICADIPTLNFQNENGVTYNNSISAVGEGLSFFDVDPIDNNTFYYDEPSMDLQKIAKLTLLSQGPLTLPNPCEGGANCTWSFSFAGPSYDCQEKDDFDNSTGLTKDMLVPTGTNLYTSASTGTEDEFGRPLFWLTETWQNDSDIGTFYMEPTLWIGFVYNTTEFISWDLPWPYRIDPHVVECTLYNTTYNYNMSFKDGVMSVNNFSKTLIAPALPSGSSMIPTDPNYEAFSAYHGAGYLFRNTLSLNITQINSTQFAQTNSEISQTSLINPDTTFPVPDFPTKVEQQFSNIILSLASFPSFYSQVNISGPCIITAAVLEWDYHPFWLAFPYGLAAGVTLITIGIGLYAFRTNGYSADTNFSTFLTTTRNPSLDKLSEGNCLGQTPLPKDFMRLKLRFGEIEGGNSEYDKGVGRGREHVAFGLADETKEIMFGKKYA